MFYLANPCGIFAKVLKTVCKKICSLNVFCGEYKLLKIPQRQRQDKENQSNIFELVSKIDSPYCTVLFHNLAFIVQACGQEEILPGQHGLPLLPLLHVRLLPRHLWWRYSQTLQVKIELCCLATFCQDVLSESGCIH